MSTLLILCHDFVEKRQVGVGSIPHASCCCHLSWNESLAFGLHGDGVPDWNSHSLFAHLMSVYFSPSHLCAFFPSPVHAGAAFG